MTKLGRLAAVAWFSLPLCGQTGSLTLSAGSATPGGTISMNITLASAAGQAPSALEWTLTYLASDILAINVTPTPALQASGKEILCNQLSGSDTCLATGLNTSVISDGVVAVVTVTPSPTAGAVLSNLVNSAGSDAQGNSIAISAFTVTPGGPMQIPVTTMATPVPGTGIAQTFLVTITDPDGFANITTLGIGFLDAVPQPSSCYSSLSFSSKDLYLINDDGSSYHNPPAVFGASGSVENSYCRIDTSAVTVSGAGSVLSLALPITFKTSGVKNIYAYASNAGGGSETYHALGTWVVPSVGPTLSVAKTHNGNFTQGQMGSYTIAVSNISGSATDGTAVTVVDTLPSGLTAAAMGGAGWNCNVSTVSCMRNDSLAVNSSYPAISLTVNIAANAPAILTNQVNVSGGGQLNGASATDTVAVARVAAAISATGGTPQSTTVGTPFTTALRATVKDAGGAGVAGVTVTFTPPVSGASGTFAGGINTAVTNNAGVATSPVFTANNTAGDYTVTASVPGIIANASFSLTNNSISPASITATAGNGQSTVIGTAFAAPLSATVRDSAGNPVAGYLVTFIAPLSGASGTFTSGNHSTVATNALGVATSPIFTANSTPGAYTVVAWCSNIALTASFSLTNSASAPSTSAIFVKADSTTQGNWQWVYGADGYNVIGDLASNPSYAAPLASGQASYTWAPSTPDVRALQKATNPWDRIAGTWYAANSFVIDSNITDSALHQVALYFLDWDTTTRRETIDVLDSNGAVLNTQTLASSFNGGVYLVWNVTGHVKFRVTLTEGTNAVLSGLFFDGPAPPSATASFLKADTTTQGNWRSAYGADGYNVIGDLAGNPSYAAPLASGQAYYTWAPSTSDVRALQKASNPADRIAATWYAENSFLIDSNITDSATHQVALYFLDWDTTTRRETIDVLDSNGAVLNTQTLASSFNGGVYLVWNVTGHVKFRVTISSGTNAVLSGLFFGGPG